MTGPKDYEPLVDIDSDTFVVDEAAGNSKERVVGKLTGASINTVRTESGKTSKSHSKANNSGNIPRK